MALPLLAYAAPLVTSYASKQLFGSGGSGAQDSINQQRQRLTTQQGRYDTLTDQYWNESQTNRTAYNEAANKYTRFLEDPYASSADDTADLDNAQARGVGAAERAKANVASGAARRGITDSSATMGANTAIESSLAATRAAGANSLAMEQIRQREIRKKTLVNFLADRMARSNSGLGSSMSGSNTLTSQLLSSFGGDRDFDRQNSAQQGSDIMALAGELGKFFEQKGAK